MKGFAASIFTLVFFGISTVVSVALPPSPFSIYSPSSALSEHPTSVIKGLHVFGKGSGIAYTSDSLFRTEDSGSSWQQLPLTFTLGFRISAVSFTDGHTGLVLLGRSDGAFELARTSDGGQTWSRVPAVFEDADQVGISTDNVQLSTSADGILLASARIPTSSNFVGRAIYRSKDGGRSWSLVKRSVEPSDEGDGTSMTRHANWVIETKGECLGYKAGCVQTSNLFILGKNVTPPQIRDRARAEFEKARVEADQYRTFAAPPGGSIRTSLNRGFDKCQAGTIAQMQLWWDNSYFFDTNIYFSGRARACPTQPFTNNPAWIDAISAQGWGIIPTVVGYQSPCSVSSTIHKHSSDPAVSETQGRGEADIAAADAASIGLTAGSVLYYDMEQYNVPSPDTLGCRAATVAFLKGWTERIRELGYVSGVYGSPRNAQEDWVTLPPASRMDAIWMARWDNIPSVWTYGLFPNFPTNFWNNHQRIKQWQAPHNETWGGVTFNIDGNIADGPVAGIPAPRNKVADFDGDQKTDISVFRPATGQWFVAGTLGPSYNIYEFGTAEDILAPGDYDGDGKTDLVVFRPSNSTWYLRTKGSFNVRQYGEPGDIPAPADYNGDRRTDIAVFRPSTGTWYIAFSDSLNSFVQIPFGQIGDRPAAADYDGDGKADVAVWRPSNGTWYIQGSAGSYFVATWGEAGDIPAQADYDGDGKADLGVFRPSAGAWYLQRTTEGFLTQQFGADGDQPATGDYDGDGRYDIAVFRPSNNTWYTSQSQAGYIVREFGAPNDKPIPAAYLPRP